MRNSTLVMTGFGIDWDTGEFEYHDWAHWTGEVRVMGWSAQNGTSDGYDVGLDYVDYLAHHPSTALHIATKLVTRFVADAPPTALVDTLGETYLDHDTAIVPVLRELFRSSAFDGSIGQKVRRPMQDTVATMRVLGIKPDASGERRHARPVLDGLGPGRRADGVGAAERVPRRRRRVALGRRAARAMEHAQSLAAHWWPDAAPAARTCASCSRATLPATHGALVDALAKRLVFRTLAADASRRGARACSGAPPAIRSPTTTTLVGWRLAYVVALILDSPYHEVR